jgi:hypothetical protein
LYLRSKGDFAAKKWRNSKKYIWINGFSVERKTANRSEIGLLVANVAANTYPLPKQRKEYPGELQGKSQNPGTYLSRLSWRRLCMCPHGRLEPPD